MKIATVTWQDERGGGVHGWFGGAPVPVPSSTLTVPESDVGRNNVDFSVAVEVAHGQREGLRASYGNSAQAPNEP